MKKFTRLTSRMVPLPVNDVDTDQIIPARFLTVTDKEGLGKSLFCDWRYDDYGAPRADFVLNRPASEGAKILLAGRNFGCGSSREHAPWALTDWGFRAVIAPSFADIFANNALKNGLLTVRLEQDVWASLVDQVQRDTRVEVTVDLERRVLVLPDGNEAGFPIDDFSRKCLLEGTDELEYIMSFAQAISAFEGRR
ncbi:MAG: 3-isopropylmalate dehydratase small subunit [Deltaproteobacteria bacterium]|nr:3-isopropylmalate dehydratase small subunit [Deltaproteobacteria bacterium]